jgi:hypothetical protein
VHFHGLDFSGLDFSTTATSRLSPCEAVNLHGTTTTCSTTDDVLLMEAQQQNGHTSLHSDLYGSFKGSIYYLKIVVIEVVFQMSLLLFGSFQG